METQELIVLSRQEVKLKLKNLLCSEHFCGLCYETGKCFNVINEELKIVADMWSQNMSIKDVCSYVFHKFEDIPASQQICSECTEQLKEAYIFIKNCKLVTKLLSAYIDDLESKSNDLITHLEENIEIKSTNIVIVLENYDKEKQMPKEIEKESLIKIEEGNLQGKMFNTTDKITYKYLECSKELPTMLLWKQHTTEYHKQAFKCEICLKTFENQVYLNCHYKVHSKVRCKICHMILPDRELKDHLRERHENDVYLCNICSDAFYTLEGLRTHAKTLHAIQKEESSHCAICCLNLHEDKIHVCRYKCPDCNEVPCIHNKYLISYREQMLNHVPKVKCLDCDYVCKTKDILIEHVNREHLNHHPYTCDKCGEQFYSKIVLTAHIKSFHRYIICCKYCNMESDSSNDLKNHETNCKLIERKYMCKRCPASFNIYEHFEKHKKRRHNELFPSGSYDKEFLKEHNDIVKVRRGLQIQNRRSYLECVICQENCDTKRELIRHMKQHGPNKKYPCRICNTEYDNLRKLRAHNRKHVGPFATCNICGKYMRKVLLAKHIENHKFDGLVTCNTCGKRFQNITHLKYHQKSHLDNVPCPKCDRLINPAKMRRHLKIHEDPSLKENRKLKANIKCEQCKYITWNNILLDCHMNRHHLKIKPYVCHICSKDFVGKHLLKKHIESHTLDKRVVCVICDKKFANPTCLKLHLRLHTGEKNYPCDVCGEKFRSSSIMNVHKRKKHAERDNACPLCSSKFYTLGELRRHVVKVHWKDNTKRFDPRELKGLENHYHLFHDGRRIKINEKDVDFYMPC